MALQLIQLGKEVEYISLDPSKVPYSFQIRLGGLTYQMTLHYNPVGEFFSCDLHTASGEVLVYGDVLRYGRQLFGSVEDERFPLPALLAWSVNDQVSEITWDNLGSLVQLYIIERGNER